MMSLRTYTRLPSIQNGYELDDQFSVVVPIATTNIIVNPSFETNTTSWTAIGGSIARSTLFQYHGAYSLAITPTAATTDGARYDTVALTTGVMYGYSAKVLGQAGVSYKLCIETTAGVELTSIVFVASGRWQWVGGYWYESTTTTRRFTIRKNGSASTAIFYIDGAQVEIVVPGNTFTTYCDGDQLGFVPNQVPVAYAWSGTPHASTSTRSGLTRAGGMVIPFKQFGFLLTAIVGLGLAAPQNVATEYARIDGGYDDYTRKPTRQFTLSGQFQAGTDYLQLRQQRGGLAHLLDRDLVGQDQRLLLKREVIDPCGTTQSTTCQLPVKYQGGLQGNTDNQIAEQAAITFTQYLPNVLSDGEAGAALSVQTNIASNANGILQRSPAGVWSSMGSVTAGFKVISTARGLDGLIYVGGDFTPAPANDVASWNGSAFSAMGSGAAGGFVYQLAVFPNGNIVAVGTFTSMGGVANTNKVAVWNGAAWTSISAAFVGTEIRCAVMGANGVLYVGGVFSSIGGVAATNVTSYNPATTTWAALGAGIAAGGVSALAASGTTIYAAVENNNVQKWNGSAWANIGTATGGGSDPQALAIGPNGVLYAAGDFTTIGGVAANYIASYNGVTWSPLGAGLNNSVNVLALSFDARGLLHAGGTFTTAGGITTPTGGAIWNGATWVYEDIIPAATASMYGSLSLPNGQFYIGTTNGGSAIGPGTTTITNTGSARAYPIIKIYGPSSGTARIYSIYNATTNRSMWLNLTISAGEVCTLVFQPDSLSFTSTFQGNIANSILSGSNTADFFLDPGANNIAFLSASSTVVATLYYRPAYVTLDDVP